MAGLGTEGSFHELIRRRIESSTRAVEPFEIVWPTYFDAYIDGEPSFTYVLDRTFKRPRDVIRFLKHAINQALNRGHLRVLAEDFQVAERLYSEDQLTDISFELRDISPSYDELLYNFIGERRELTQGEVYSILLAAKVADAELDRALRLLLWFGFLGVIDRLGEEKYAYEYRHNVDRLLKEGGTPPTFVIHPAFRKALGTA